VNILKIYQNVFEYFCENQKGRAEPWQVHGHLLVTATTAPLMWSYTYVAWNHISSPIPGIVGLVCSLIHLLSPLTLRMGFPIMLTLNLILIPGITHQATFSYHVGGFMSNILVWFGILPFLAGIIGGRKGAILWFFITLSVSGTYLYMHLNGFPFPNRIDEQGKFISHILLVFGQIYLSAGLLWAFILLKEQNENQLTEKNQKIQNLLRVVCHDISNPLFIVENRLIRIIKDEPDENLKKTYWAANNIKEIVRDVRNMAKFDEQKNPQIKEIDLSEILAHIDMLFEEKLYTKEISLNIDDQLKDNLVITGNENAIRNQIFPNLVSNCIKFSFPGNEIDISLSEVNEKTVRITIEDKGIGIPPEIMNNIYEPDSKNSRIGTAGEKGTGFGIPIVKQAMEKIGGTFFIESDETYPNPGHGTLYVLEFNRA